MKPSERYTRLTQFLCWSMLTSTLVLREEGPRLYLPRKKFTLSISLMQSSKRTSTWRGLIRFWRSFARKSSAIIWITFIRTVTYFKRPKFQPQIKMRSKWLLSLCLAKLFMKWILSAKLSALASHMRSSRSPLILVRKKLSKSRFKDCPAASQKLRQKQWRWPQLNRSPSFKVLRERVKLSSSQPSSLSGINKERQSK